VGPLTGSAGADRRHRERQRRARRRPAGDAGTPRQLEKEAFLRAAAGRIGALAADGRHVLLTGDLNVAHREADLKNWKGNVKKSGFLPQERAWFDRLLEDGAWVDVVRALTGVGPGPYSWWSWRGKAFDLDSGWRIDYQIASAGLAERAVKAETDRAPSYVERWSDHAAVVVRYDLTAVAGELTIRSRPECLAS
jgi:exodeoxyribonuclease-3